MNNGITGDTRWNYEYDSEADAICIQRRGCHPAHTIEYDEDLLLDVKSDGSVTSVELLGASRHMNCSVKQLTSPHCVYACLEGNCFTLRFDNNVDLTYKTRIASDGKFGRIRKFLLRIYPHRRC